MEVWVRKEGFIFYGTGQELKDWLATFPREWTLEQLVQSHFH